MIKLMLWNVINGENEIIGTVETPVNSIKKAQKVAMSKVGSRWGCLGYRRVEYIKTIEK